MSILDKLTEGIVQRDLRQEGHALLSKWEKTGLLEGITDERRKASMSVLLENQAKELLREASSMAAGDVEGFAAVAFPIVRRVFGGLIANELVSVQPMSLPSGLIFFLDFQKLTARVGGTAGDSLYGGGVVGLQITGGVDLDDSGSESSFYSLANGYSSATGSATLTAVTKIASGVVGDADADTTVTAATLGGSAIETSINKLCKFDPDLSGSAVGIYTVQGDRELAQLSRNNLVSLAIGAAADASGGASDNNIDSNIVYHVRRLNQAFGRTAAAASRPLQKLDLTDADETSLVIVVASTGSSEGTTSTAGAAQLTNIDNLMTSKTPGVTFAITDNFGGDATAAGSGAPAASSNAVGVVTPAATWGLEGADEIPEIDIKVDSISVTAMTKKLKAKWTPELGQDLNAYHNLDAEVELTSILSEQIALEIDREIINDLVQGATAGRYYWARSPGLFVNRESGFEIGASSAAPDFTGTVSEWYETLIETINDVSAQIHRKTLRGGANFVVCSPEVANILEFTAGFRASVTADDDRGTIGAVKTGSLSKKFDVYVDPYFPRNVILVGRKGGSFLESGYVYAPYVPLQVTPTIFGVEDFVPRKGVMTRYAKKMVRPDMYGIVIVRGLLGEPGSTGA